MAFSKATITVTIASPAVVTWTAHGLANGTPVSFTTTGALPTGLLAYGDVGSIYYVSNAATDTFELKNTAGTTINTSGSQSGTHTGMTGEGDQIDDNPVSVTFTNGANAEVSWTAHRFKLNDPVVFNAIGGSMPGGVLAGVLYYVQAIVNANTFRISQTYKGSALTTSSTGSSVTGFSAVDVCFGEQQVTISNVPLAAKVGIAGMVNGSRWRLSENSTNTEIASGVAGATGIASASTKFKGLVKLDVRKASSGTKYLPLLGYGDTTSGDVSIYVSQIQDTVA